MGALMFVLEWTAELLKLIGARMVQLAVTVGVLFGAYEAWTWWAAGARLWNGVQLR